MSWTSALALLAALGVLALGPVGGEAAEPSGPMGPAPAQRSPAMPASAATDQALRLGGPFGSVPGEPLGSLAPSAGDAGIVLDAFVRSAPLRLEVGRPPRPIVEWLVTGTSLEGGRAVMLAASHPGDRPATSLRFQGPDLPGRYDVTATVRTAAGDELGATWTIQVPDRPAPEDGLLEVPAPALTLSSGAGSISGWPGNGCYIYLCVEVGRLPPLETLERLAVSTGEPMRLRLTDGSRVARWEAAYLPILGRLQPATARRSGSPAVPVAELTLQAPAAGEWLLMVEIGYDRERGWAQVFFRLTATDGTPEPAKPG